MNANPKGGIQTGQKKLVGKLKGRLAVPEDFDAPLPDEVQAEFEGLASSEPGDDIPAVGGNPGRRTGAGQSSDHCPEPGSQV